MSIEKYDMFKNRLLKNYKHRYKQAKRQNITCWRLYDHDLPEFPICIELYEDYIYIAEYNRRHGMSANTHKLMRHGEATQDHPVIHDHMAGQLGVVGENRVIAHNAVVRQMHVRHDPVVVTDRRHGTIAR